MDKHQLGLTSLHITPLTLGTMQFFWTVPEKEAFYLLDAYTDAGGNFIDTADMYTQWAQGGKGGEAETIIGKWMHQRKNRENIILSSKVRSRMWEGKDGEGLSRNHILKACDDSLRRLQTEYLDLYFSHWPDEDTQEEETLRAYQSLQEQGKIRFLGCSNYNPQQLSHALSLKEKGLPTYTVIQALYNIVDRSYFEKELLPLVQKHNLGVLAYSPLASGFLTGLFRKDKPLPPHTRLAFIKSKLTEKNFTLLDILDELALRHQATLPQIAAVAAIWDNRMVRVGYQSA